MASYFSSTLPHGLLLAGVWDIHMTAAVGALAKTGTHFCEQVKLTVTFVLDFVGCLVDVLTDL